MPILIGTVQLACQISNSLYLDYNATSPLSDSVIKWLRKGEIVWGNPSSTHTPGRKAKSEILAVKAYLLNLFGLVETHNLFFHSGATEGINTIILGTLRKRFENDGRWPTFYASPTDHSAVIELGRSLKDSPFSLLKVDGHGMISVDVAKELKEGSVLNFTWVNNETGLVYPLDEASKLKEKKNLFIHVDAVQAPGKIKDFQKLDPRLDAYTFSGHKIGSLKGIGFTLIKKDLPFVPLTYGGGQQGGMRSGTENVQGIVSLKLAMEDLVKNFSFEKVKENKLFFESELKSNFGEKITIVGEASPFRNCNTVTFTNSFASSDILMAALDIEGIYVAKGSACSSNISRPSPALNALGLSNLDASRGLRVSFSPYLKRGEVESVIERMIPIMKKFSHS